MQQRDPTNVLETILGRAGQLLGTPHGFVNLCNPGSGQVEFELGVGFFLDARQSADRLREELTRRVLQSGEPAAINGLSDTPLRSLALAPLRSGSEFVGTIALAYAADSLRSFGETELDLLTAVADLASIALDNARLYTAEHNAREEAERLRAATRALGGTVELREVLRLILSELQQVVPCDSTTVQELHGHRMEIVGGHGFPNVEDLIGFSFDINDDNPNRLVYQTRAPVIIEDAPARFPRFEDVPHQPAGIRSCLAVPLLFRDRLIGMLTLDKKEPAFYTQEHARMASSFAAHAAIALENARLFSSARRELSERQRTQAALAILSSAVEQTADHVLITDTEGVIEYVNPAFEKHTGYNSAAAVGQTPRILKSGEHVEGFYTSMWEQLGRGEVYRGVFINKRKNGSIFYEDKTIAPIRDARGQLTHFVSTGRDITERRRAEEAQATLQEAIRKGALEWQATFDAVDSPVLLLDPDGRVRRPNRAAREAWGGGDIVGLRVSEPGRGALWEGVARAAEAVAKDGRAVSLQVKDPVSGKTWDLGAAPLSPARVERGGTIVVARDVSGIVELQESLRHSERMAAMGTLVAGVAHEVRNPLFAISATLDAFEAEFGDREGRDFFEYTERLRGEVQRLSRLMQDLLEYGRPGPTQFEEGDVREVIQQALRSCTQVAREAQVDLASEVPSGLPVVSMDRERLCEVFLNVIENAVQHSPRGGTVSVKAHAVANGKAGLRECVCVVEDSGPGFREQDIGRVFEPFFTQRHGGTGLGLAIVQRIVEEHGGLVCAANRSGGGAAVTVNLPVRTP